MLAYPNKPLNVTDSLTGQDTVSLEYWVLYRFMNSLYCYYGNALFCLLREQAPSAAVVSYSSRPDDPVRSLCICFKIRQVLAVCWQTLLQADKGIQRQREFS